MKYPDLKSLLANDARYLALLRALRRLAAAAGNTNTDADAAYHEVRWAIERLEGRVLSEGRAGERKRAAKTPPTSPRGAPRITISRLVRIKAYELGIGQPRRSNAWNTTLKKDFPLDEKSQLAFRKSDLTPVETRAAEIVRGRPRKASKNFAEIEAIGLADAVLADWPMLTQRAGRPAGRRRIVRDPQTLEYDLKLSAREIIAAVLPIVEALAGPENSLAPESAMITAVVAAVKAADIDPKTIPTKKKIKAAGTATRPEFDAQRASNIVRKLLQSHPIS